MVAAFVENVPKIYLLYGNVFLIVNVNISHAFKKLNTSDYKSLDSSKLQSLIESGTSFARSLLELQFLLRKLCYGAKVVVLPSPHLLRH